MRSEPYQTVEGIEFRAVTLTAYKGKEGPCIERNHAVIYRGPWKEVVDDDGHTLERGARMVETLITNTMLPDIGQEFLTRQINDTPVKRVHIGVNGTAFTYAFD